MDILIPVALSYMARLSQANSQETNPALALHQKLTSGEYKNCSSAWDLLKSVEEVFKGVQLMKDPELNQAAIKLSEDFEAEVTPLMKSLGYCCGRSQYAFTLDSLSCHERQCKIEKNAAYFSYEHRDQNSAVEFTYNICPKCFSRRKGVFSLRNEAIKIPMKVAKSAFEKRVNDVLKMEPLVQCTECQVQVHEICVLHNKNIWPEGFLCDQCHEQLGTSRHKSNMFTAKQLPETRLSRFIEGEVQRFLQQKEQTDARPVHIRVVFSDYKAVQLLPGFRKFCSAQQKTIPYKARVILAFQEADEGNAELCFFALRVQEYDSEAAMANYRRLYIAYLDSVRCFEPRQLRTGIYHEIMIAYLQYMKELGYMQAHLWACPPNPGDEYIFNCHPPSQQNPSRERLQTWYKRMITTAIHKGVVLSYNDIYGQACEDRLSSLAQVPYFDGDFWPNALEDIIKQDKNGRKRTKQVSLLDRLYGLMEKEQEDHFVIHLQERGEKGPLSEDPDPLNSCELMNERGTFVGLAQEENWEFSSLRRSKYSSMALLYELHQQSDVEVVTCNLCLLSIGRSPFYFHCTTCDDFDLCTACYDRIGHPHPVTEEQSSLYDGVSEKQAHLLAHAFYCEGQEACRLASCAEMRRLVAHFKVFGNKGCQKCSSVANVMSKHDMRTCHKPESVRPLMEHIKSRWEGAAGPAEYPLAKRARIEAS